MHEQNRPHIVECLGLLLAVIVLFGFGTLYNNYEADLLQAEAQGAQLESECAYWQAEHVRRGLAFPHDEMLDHATVMDANEKSDVEMTTGG